MSSNFQKNHRTEIGLQTDISTLPAKEAGETSRRQFGKGFRKGYKWPRGKRPVQKTVPKRLAVARKAASEGGVVVVAFLADTSTRAILSVPRIESRGFFLPHEIREGHKLLLSESRRSYEETLKDVPDIETKDLEKIVKKDLEKAISEKFSRSPLIIILIQTL